MSAAGTCNSFIALEPDDLGFKLYSTAEHVVGAVPSDFSVLNQCLFSVLEYGLVVGCRAKADTPLDSPVDIGINELVLLLGVKISGAVYQVALNITVHRTDWVHCYLVSVLVNTVLFHEVLRLCPSTAAVVESFSV